MTWPPATLPGLHVDLGEQTRRGKWIRLPSVDVRCAHGWTYGTAGADEVAYVCRHLTDLHAKYCPGTTREDPHAR